MIYWHQLNNEGDILTPEDPSPHPVAHHTKPHLSSQYVLFQWLSWSLINGFNLKQRPWGVCVCARVYVSIAHFLYILYHSLRCSVEESMHFHHRSNTFIHIHIRKRMSFHTIKPLLYACKIILYDLELFTIPYW